MCINLLYLVYFFYCAQLTKWLTNTFIIRYYNVFAMRLGTTGNVHSALTITRFSLCLSYFRKSSAGEGPREGELEDLHEDEPSS